MANIQKIENDIARTKQTITEQQNRLRELECKKKEAENSELLGLIREGNISKGDIVKLIKQKTPPNEQEVKSQ